MERVLKRKQLVDELAERTQFYKYNIEAMLDALDDIIVENMSMATKTEPSEVHLSLGFVFGGRYAPKREAKDPRDGSTIMTKAKYIPYARFTQSFRNKINKKG
jgi:nucleoid DNA-binding protein